jgi:hypothetical protein
MGVGVEVWIGICVEVGKAVAVAGGVGAAQEVRRIAARNMICRLLGMASSGYDNFSRAMISFSCRLFSSAWRLAGFARIIGKTLKL